MPLRRVDEIIDDYTGHSRTVLEYSQIVKRLVDRAKQPGFSVESWSPLAALVAVDEFERIGNFKEVMSWDEYTRFLTGWAPTASWDCSFKRVTESGDVVFLELEEHSEIGDFKSSVNSLSVYELDAGGRIRHIDVYLQMPLPSGTTFEGYEGVQISE